ncbi:MAG TPA: TonB-dependent receptor [Opitutaceae bacterium]|nr:TonB-dependent receptor [Opitutaceae bacterium]
MTVRFPRLLASLLALTAALSAQDPPGAKVRGTLADGATGAPLAGLGIHLQRVGEIGPAASAVTDAGGAFLFAGVPAGEFTVVAAREGGGATAPFSVPARQAAVDVGQLVVKPGEAAAVTLAAVEVSARREAFYDALDRKVYDVGRDLRSATGSASDVLQGIPSVQVDVDGEVSLRGDESVLILINGKTSAQMGRDRAAALEQMSADRIERIEVITNPSAKHRPDGTAGIINIVLKRDEPPGLAGTARFNVGAADRFNASLNASYNPGPFELFGRVSYRQDRRSREDGEFRLRRSSGLSTEQHTQDEFRPRFRFLEGGVDFRPSPTTEFGVSLGWNAREFTHRQRQRHVTRDPAGAALAEQERTGTGVEADDDIEVAARFSHAFAAPGRKFAAELRWERDDEQEDDFFTDIERLPVVVESRAWTRILAEEGDLEFSADYSHPFPEGEFEAGYAGARESSDVDLRTMVLAAGDGVWVGDSARTNRFIHETTVHALYATYARPVGRWAFQAGLRYEQAAVDTDQVTLGGRDLNRYTRLYPSLHVTFEPAEAHQLRLSYSHRVNRPDGDQLNPFPEQHDPFNLEAGNPDLLPEQIHSVEAGYQYRQNEVTYLASLYVRQRYDGITEVTRFLDDRTVMTTPENLSRSRSSGLELGVTTRLWDRLSLNLSANAYRNEIDARNLGFAGRREATAWEAKLNAQWQATKALLVQVNSGYVARRLTPQGERRPTHLTSLGLRYDLPNRRSAIVLTVSDVFDSFRRETILDTPDILRESARRHRSRIVYLGFQHRFGGRGRDADEMEFEEPI